jgi:hypothetical protein
MDCRLPVITQRKTGVRRNGCSDERKEVLALVAATTYLVAQNRTARAERIARWARLAFPVVFGAVFLLIWWI